MAKQNRTNTTVQTGKSELTPTRTPRIVEELVSIMESSTGGDPVVRVTRALLNHQTFKNAQLLNYQNALTVRIRGRLEGKSVQLPLP